MNDSDVSMQRRLARLVDDQPLDVEADLQSLLQRVENKSKSRRWAGKSAALLVALALSVPTVAAAYFLERASSGSREVVPRTVPIIPQIPQIAIPLQWGGTLLWAAGDGSVQISSTDVQDALPCGPIRGTLSPLGPSGGVYGLTEEDPFAQICYPEDGAETVEVTTAPYQEHMMPPAWSPDGQTVAIELCSSAADNDCSIRLVTVRNGASVEFVPSNGQGVSWSPDGSHIAYIDRNRSVSIVDIGIGVSEEVLPIGTYDDLSRPVWAPTGEYIAVLAFSSDGHVPLVTTIDGDVVGVGQPSGGEGPKLEWRRDTNELLYATTDPVGISSSLRHMAAPSWASSLILEVSNHDQPLPFSSPDGRAVLLQTLDHQKFVDTGVGAEGIPYRWTVIDLESFEQQEWDVVDTEILDWR